MAWVEPMTVPAMLIGDRIIDAVRVRAINTELFTSRVEMSVSSSQAIINLPTRTLSGDGLSLVLGYRNRQE